MSRSELHNWECAIEQLSGDNADKMLAIAQDIYNTAFVRGKNYMSLEQKSVLDNIKAEILDEAEYAYADFDEYKEDILHAEPDELPDDDFRYGLERAIEIIDKYRTESEVEE